MDEPRDQPGSIIDYLFVATARPALGTKDYFIPGSRLFRPEEGDVAIGALKVQAEVIEGAHPRQL